MILSLYHDESSRDGNPFDFQDSFSAKKFGGQQQKPQTSQAPQTVPGGGGAGGMFGGSGGGGGGGGFGGASEGEARLGREAVSKPRPFSEHDRAYVSES